MEFLKFLTTPQAAQIIAEAGLIPDVQGYSATNPLANQMLAFAKNGKTAYPMIDNVIQGDVVTTGAKQLDAALGGNISAQDGAEEHEADARLAARRTAGARLPLDGVPTGLAAGRAARPAASKSVEEARPPSSRRTAGASRRGGARSRRSGAAPGSSSRCRSSRWSASLLLIPIGQTFYYSFTNWDGFTSQWVGIAAYRRLFHNPEFATVLENNAVMVLAIPVAIVAAARRSRS